MSEQLTEPGADTIGFDGPDATGHFGPYGGIFVGETLIAAVEELAQVYQELSSNEAFWSEFDSELKHYVGRPSPLYFAERLTAACGGARIYLKREDLNHTGAHKVNNTIGQALLAKHMGKTRIIAETGAGGWRPDLVHAHDWQAGLVPLLIKMRTMNSRQDACSQFTT